VAAAQGAARAGGCFSWYCLFSISLNESLHLRVKRSGAFA
jgi:hypothetical protein